MNYTYYKPQPEKQGVISNLHGFLHRYLDTGFKSKWSGYWVPPFKYLDYFSFKLNGVWLDAETLKGIEYGEKMVFHHETDSFEIKEKISTPEGFPGLKVELDISNKTEDIKALQASMETGIDIRSKSEDISESEYELKKTEEKIVASRNGKKLVIEPNDVSGFKGESYTKEHFPGERQVCLVPQKPVFRREIEGGTTEKIEIEFKTSEPSFKQIESKDQKLEHHLGRAFNDSIDSLENLIYDRKGSGMIAGHPWFQNYWARDSFWSLLGLIDAGYFEESKEILENFAERDVPGKIGLEGEEESIERSDTAPLYIIAADKLRKNHGISEKIREGMKDCMKKLEMEDKVIKHSPEGTWMDTLEREKAVDIQSLWLEAAKIMNDEREEKLREGLQKFQEKGMLKDELEGGHKTINPAVPLMFGQLEPEDAEKQLEKINGEFSSRYGARTRSVTDPGYNSSGYHTGSVWGLTTCWAAAANLEYGKNREGLNFMEKLNEFLDRDQPGALPEVVDAESGELLGCPEQAWSAGLFIHVVDSYLLGIKVSEDHVTIDPVEGLNCKRTGKRINDEELDIKVEDGEVEILNETELDLRL